MPRPKSAGFEPAMGESRYSTVPSTAYKVPGEILRATRKKYGMDVGTLAKLLRVPAPKLVAVELGTAAFANPECYGDAALYIARSVWKGRERADKAARGEVPAKKSFAAL